MADLSRIRERIHELAGRRRNVTPAEIEWIVNQLGMLGDGRLYVAGNDVAGKARFAVCPHNKDAKQGKCCYVDEFLTAMVKLGLYEE